jgi:hypothetical protein
MIVYKKTIICYGILFVIFYFSHSVLGAELVGISPLSNQRHWKQNDWLGYYLQARIKANLELNSDWLFHPQSVLSLWALRPDRSQPISPQTTIVIEGSFQQVVELGHISLRVKRVIPDKERMESFEISYTRDNLDRQIDLLSEQIGSWIQPGFKLKKVAPFPQQDQPGVPELYAMNQKLSAPEGLPDIREILYLEEIVGGKSPYELICGLGEAIVVLSQSLVDRERKSILKKAEVLLREAILNHKSRSRLYSLLAEVYYLSGNYASWIEKTAEDAVRLDPQNDLGYLLKIMINASDADARSKDVDLLKKVNPWLFTDVVDGARFFQNGILKEELSRLKNENH